MRKCWVDPNNILRFVLHVIFEHEYKKEVCACMKTNINVAVQT